MSDNGRERDIRNAERAQSDEEDPGRGEPSDGLLSGMATMSGINDENIAAEASAASAAAEEGRVED